VIVEARSPLAPLKKQGGFIVTGDYIIEGAIG